jgi:hypothetical protein
MKIQHKMALAVLGGILVVLAVFLLIAWMQGDETNADNGGGAGLSRPGSGQVVNAVEVA